VRGLATNTVIEAIATDTPIISAEWGEIDALYDHLANVYILDCYPGAYGGIPAEQLPAVIRDTADKIVEVLNASLISANVGTGAGARFYSWKQRLQDELDLYEAVLASSSNG